MCLFLLYSFDAVSVMEPPAALSGNHAMGPLISGGCMSKIRNLKFRCVNARFLDKMSICTPEFPKMTS